MRGVVDVTKVTVVIFDGAQEVNSLGGGGAVSLFFEFGFLATITNK